MRGVGEMDRQVHQLVHTLSYGDAISTEVLALRRCLRELGIASEIFAINTNPKYARETRDYRTFPREYRGEVVMHYSLGSPLNKLYQDLSTAQRTLIYHNLTPPRWFERVNPRVTADIEQGVRELPELCRISDRLLADSSFNAQELHTLGFEASVLPLMVDPGRWNIPSNQGIAHMLRQEGGIHLLHVGRLAPNKCVEDIIRIFYFVHHYLEKKSRLWLVGIDIDTELYSFALKRLVRELALEDVVQFVGCMADEEVKALYEQASAYVCMSEHEGFCLPVIEAMQFGLPVIAFSAAAVAETVASGGILVREKKHPEIAELVAKLVRDLPFRAEVVDAGRRRAADFSYERFAAQVASIYAPSLGTEQGTSAAPVVAGDPARG